MGSKSGNRLFGSTFLGLSVAGITAAALANPPPHGWYAIQGGGGPANGVIALNFNCESIPCASDSCLFEPLPGTFELLDASNNAVPGTLVSTRGPSWHFAFKPDAELAVGTYSAKLSRASFPFPIQVTDPVAWSSKPEVHEEFEAVEEPGDGSCCETDADASPDSVSCKVSKCFSREVHRTTRVLLDWTQHRPEEFGQYAFRVLTAQNPDPDWRVGDPKYELWLQEPGESLCYALELKRLADDVVFQYDERCVERPAALGEAGVFPVDPSELAGELPACTAPPSGYEAEWCQAKAATCAGSSDAGCETYAQACTSGGPSSSGTPSDEEADDRPDGCSYSARGERRTNAALGLLALGAVLVVTRRRRATRTRASSRADRVK